MASKIPSPSEPSIGELVDLLGDERRRAIVAYINEAGGPVALDALVKVLSDPERTADGRRDDPDSDRLRVLLHHVDLPKLADYGLVEYDPERLTAEPTS